MQRSTRGSVVQHVLVVLGLLGALGAAGAWNYQRNLELEGREVRPYGSLTDEDLALLLEATEAELEALGGTLELAHAAPASADDGASRWSEFEAAQRRSRAKRDRATRIAGHEGSVRALREERARRERDADATRVFFRRLLSL